MFTTVADEFPLSCRAVIALSITGFLYRNVIVHRDHYVIRITITVITTGITTIAKTIHLPISALPDLDLNWI